MFSKRVTWRMLGACGRVSPNLERRKKACEFWEGGEGEEGKIPRFLSFREKHQWN